MQRYLWIQKNFSEICDIFDEGLKAISLFIKEQLFRLRFSAIEQSEQPGLRRGLILIAIVGGWVGVRKAL
jgi:hypothetical protein